MSIYLNALTIACMLGQQMILIEDLPSIRQGKEVNMYDPEEHKK